MKKLFLSFGIALAAMCFAPVNSDAAEMQVTNQVSELSVSDKEVIIIVVETPDEIIIVVVERP